MEYVGSLSCGKDSLAMVLRLMKERQPLTKCVMYDTGMEYQAIYNNLERVSKPLKDYGCELVVLKPKNDFLFDMLLRPVCSGTDREHYGYEWCGGCTRWRTSGKVTAINNYLKTLDDYVQYIGIATDEPQRIKQERNKLYPLVDWNMTEKNCLQYCYDCGYNWSEDGVELYSVLDRVSCWCCGNKNLKELENMYLHLPKYWQLLKALQSRIDRPFRRDGRSIFDLEKIFKSKQENCLF